MKQLRRVRRDLYTAQRLLGFAIALLAGPRAFATHRIRAAAQKQAALNRRIR